MAKALWAAHRRRMEKMLAALRAAGRIPIWRRAIRARCACCWAEFVVAIGVGGDRAGRNFARAISPGVETIAALPGTLDLWITPPAYTGLPPLLPRLDGEIAIPAGSQLIAQVAGGRGQPRLVVDTKVQASHRWTAPPPQTHNPVRPRSRKAGASRPSSKKGSG